MNTEDITITLTRDQFVRVNKIIESRIEQLHEAVKGVTV